MTDSDGQIVIGILIFECVVKLSADCVSPPIKSL